MADLTGNPVAHLTEYELRYLAEHLETAERTEELHRLLALETSGRRNAWYQAREALSQTASFLDDVHRAWRLAGDGFTIRGSLFAVGLECRYALVLASINCFARTIPSALLIALVESETWDPFRGLACVQQVPDPKQRAETLIALIPYLPETALFAALETALGIQHELSRARALIGLAPSLPGSLKARLATAACKIDSESSRATALAGIVSHLTKASLLEAVKAAQEIQDEGARSWALGAMVPHLPKSLSAQVLQQALTDARKEELKYLRIKLLTRLVPFLSDPLKMEVFWEVLAPVRKFDYGFFEWLEAITGVIPYLPETLHAEALAVIQEVEWGEGRAPWDQGQAEALRELIHHSSETFLQKVLVAGYGIRDGFWRSRVLAEVAVHMPDPMRIKLLEDALAAAGEIQRESRRAGVLIRLAACLPESLLLKAVTAAQAIKEHRPRAEALAGIAPHLPARLMEAVLREALTAAAQSIEEGYWPDEALGRVAPHLPDALQSEALMTAMAIGGVFWRVKTLAKLIPHLKEPLRSEAARKALNAAAWEGYTPDRFEEFCVLAQHLPETMQPLRMEALNEALAATNALSGARNRREALAKLVPLLPKELLLEALAVAQAIRDRDERTWALVELAPHLPQPMLEEALALGGGIIHLDGDRRADAIAKLAPWVPEMSQEVLLARAKAIWDPRSRSKALIGLAPYLSESLLWEALAIARAAKNEGFQSDTLVGIAPCLPSTLLQEALAAALAIEDEAPRGKTLEGLAPYVPEALLQEVVEAAHVLKDSYRRGQILRYLAPGLAKARRYREALAAARASWGKQRALAELAPNLPEPLATEALLEALEHVLKQFIDNQRRAAELAWLAPHLPEPARTMAQQEALAAAHAIDSTWHGGLARAEIEEGQADILVELAPHLPQSLLRQGLTMAREIDWEPLKESVLAQLIPRLADLGYSQEAHTAARALKGVSTRVRALTGIVSHLTEPMKGEVLQEALTEVWELLTFYHVDPEADPQSPRAEALMELTPHLPEPLLQEALAAACEIGSKSHRVKPLAEIAQRLTELSSETTHTLWHEILRCLAQRPREDLLADIGALEPVIAALGGPDAVAETCRAIQDVGRWWP